MFFYDFLHSFLLLLLIIRLDVLHELFLRFFELTSDDTQKLLFVFQPLIKQKLLVSLFFVGFIEVWSMINQTLKIGIQIFTFILLLFCFVVNSFLFVVVGFVITSKFSLLVEEFICYFLSFFLFNFLLMCFLSKILQLLKDSFTLHVILHFFY